MLQNEKVTTFTTSEVLRKNQRWEGRKTTPPTQISVKYEKVKEEFPYFLKVRHRAKYSAKKTTKT